MSQVQFKGVEINVRINLDLDEAKIFRTLLGKMSYVDVCNLGYVDDAKAKRAYGLSERIFNELDSGLRMLDPKD